MKSLMDMETDPTVVHNIHKDVTRTLPNHIYFQQKFMHGQNDLFVVLKCLSIVEPQIGYMQGMGFMVAILLTYVDREDAFTIMLRLINSPKFHMKLFYTEELVALKEAFYVHLCLLKKHMPRLYAHFTKEMFTPPLYATEWFMTLFSSNMPMLMTLRIWDVVFVEGFNATHKIALAILKLNERELLKCDGEFCKYQLRDYFSQAVSKISFPNQLPTDARSNSLVIEKIN
mmetsp:Transcript_8655/g.14669  ORF Transcript_8655/g.14669 Transcript_8655/m.14669 type:complete len:229 (+) Transcript_8655:1167-1853(+)